MTSTSGTRYGGFHQWVPSAMVCSRRTMPTAVTNSIMYSSRPHRADDQLAELARRAQRRPRATSPAAARRRAGRRSRRAGSAAPSRRRCSSVTAPRPTPVASSRRDHERDLVRAQADRARRHQPQHLARRRVATGRSRTTAEAAPEQRRAAGPARWSRRADDDADGQSDSTPSDGPEQHRAADDREVVERRRERGRGEAAARVEHRGRHGAQRQQHRREQHDPRQLGRSARCCTASNPGVMSGTITRREDADDRPPARSARRASR